MRSARVRTTSRAVATNGYGVKRTPFVGCATAASAAPSRRFSASSVAATRAPTRRCASAAERLRPGPDGELAADALADPLPVAVLRAALGVGVALDREPHAA